MDVCSDFLSFRDFYTSWCPYHHHPYIPSPISPHSLPLLALTSLSDHYYFIPISSPTDPLFRAFPQWVSGSRLPCPPNRAILYTPTY